VAISEGAEHSETSVESCCERGVVGVEFDKRADVGDGGDADQEAAVRARHVEAHFVDEVVAGGRGWC